ncbi:MAG: hypothetical protein AAGA99_21110 [Actinomycetota bacterium]
MAYATPEHMCLVLGRSIEEALALLLLDAATEAIEDEIGYSLDAVSNETVEVPGSHGRKLVLPARPVTALTAAVIVDEHGDETTLDVAPTASEVVWHASGEVFRPHGYDWGGPTAKVRVTYDHGLGEVPTWVRLLCISVAGRALDNPTGGVRQEAIGAYSVTYNETTIGVDLTDADRHRLRRRFRRTSGTAHVTGR